MKFLFFSISLFIIVFLSSCKKETNSPSGYFFSMNIDGRNFTFNDSLAATKQPGNIVGLILYASSKTYGRFSGFFSDYKPGTYIDDYYDPTKKLIEEFTIIDYVYDNNNNQFYQQLMRPDPTRVPNPISLTITNVTNEYIEGSFSGSLMNASGSYSPVTNGNFRIPFK